MKNLISALMIAIIPAFGFASDGPGTLQDAMKNAQGKVGMAQIAAYGFRDGQKEALKSLDGFPAESCVENSIMADEALIELNSSANCLRARGFAFEFQKIKSVHCRPTSMAISVATEKAFQDSIRRCMQMGFTQCEIDNTEYTPTSDGYCFVRVTTRPSKNSDIETSKLVNARNLLVEARELIEENQCEEGSARGTEAKKLLESMQLPILPDSPPGKVPAYLCDDF